MTKKDFRVLPDPIVDIPTACKYCSSRSQKTWEERNKCFEQMVVAEEKFKACGGIEDREYARPSMKDWVSGYLISKAQSELSEARRLFYKAVKDDETSIHGCLSCEKDRLISSQLVK